jgi:peptidyl-prolyl cis-trans isomerase B (cyclophilin B)
MNPMSDPLNPQAQPPQNQAVQNQAQPPLYGYAPPAPGYSPLAIIAFVLAFFTSAIGVILGFVALSQIKRTGEQGRGLAIAAIVIGLAEFALVVLFIAIVAAGIAAASYHIR